MGEEKLYVAPAEDFAINREYEANALLARHVEAGKGAACAVDADANELGAEGRHPIVDFGFGVSGVVADPVAVRVFAPGEKVTFGVRGGVNDVVFRLKWRADKE